MDIDAVGTFTMCHAALRYLKKGGPGRSSSGGGTILNISATLHYTASWYQIHVSAAKVGNLDVTSIVFVFGFVLLLFFFLEPSCLNFLSAQAAVDATTRNLALEWGADYDIRVNGIAPGPIGDTPGLSKLLPEEIKSKTREYMPLYKVGEKWDIAMSALYLVSDAGWCCCCVFFFFWFSCPCEIVNYVENQSESRFFFRS